MGRGRAKAKQTKVARELKYRSVDTDFTSLERELRGPDDRARHPSGLRRTRVPPGYEDLAERYNDGDDGELRRPAQVGVIPAARPAGA